jgi:DNA (cytosine-5)-methyltransferase 1
MTSERSLAIDIFSGAGGLSEGLRLAGFKVCLAIDQEADAFGTYTANHPGTMALRSSIQKISKVDDMLRRMGYRRRDIQLVAGGPPCQGFSMANTRTRGASNGHSMLVWEFLRVVREIGPRAFLMENVPGIDSINDGKLVKMLVTRFDSLGYNVSSLRLDAAEYGVPQHRSRFFLVGCLGAEISRPKPTHGPDGKHDYVTVKDALIGDLPPLGRTCGSYEMGYLRRPASVYQKWLRTDCPILHDHITTKCGKDVKERIRLIKQGENLHTLMEFGKVPEKLEIRIDHAGVYRRLSLDVPSVTVVNFRKAMTIHPLENRLLTLREAARLQSFQDHYRFGGRLGFMQQVVGDSVPPLLAEAVAREVRRAIRSD